MAQEDDYMLQLALQMSLAGDSATQEIRPGPEEPRSVEDEKPVETGATPTATDDAEDATMSPPAASAAVAPSEDPDAVAAPAQAAEEPAPSVTPGKKPRKKQRYKDLMGGMMKSDRTEEDATKALEQKIGRTTGGGQFSKLDKI